MGTAEATGVESKGLAVATAERIDAMAEIPSAGGIIPRPVRLILAAATGSAAMPTRKVLNKKSKLLVCLINCHRLEAGFVPFIHAVGRRERKFLAFVACQILLVG